MPDKNPELVPRPGHTALDYAPLPTSGRRIARRLRRLWPVWLALLLVGLGVAFGPKVWARYKLIKLQDGWLTGTMPADRPVYESEPAAARALVAAWPNEYRFGQVHFAVRIDPRWTEMEAELGLPRTGAPPYPMPTIFCGERYTPSGQRRLVVVAGGTGGVAAVIEPAGWLGGRPRVLRTEAAIWLDPLDGNLLDGVPRPAPNHFRTYAGQPDPSDPSRFTVEFIRHGVPGTFEFRLRDDNRLTLRLLDHDGYMSRARAMAETRPASAR